MLTRSLAAVLIGGMLFGLTSLAAADESVSYSFVSGAKASAGAGNDAHGFVDCIVMFRNDRPMMAFGVQQRAGEKGRFLYVILFKPDAPKGAFSSEIGGKAGGDSAKTSTRFRWNKCDLHVEYEFEAEEKTSKLLKESLKLNDKPLAADSPRLFLIDLSGEKTALTPVKVDLPAPPLGLSTDREEHFEDLVRVVANLKKASPEVAKFLETKN